MNIKLVANAITQKKLNLIFTSAKETGEANARHARSNEICDISEELKHGRIEISIQTQEDFICENTTRKTKRNSRLIVKNLENAIRSTIRHTSGSAKKDNKSGEY